MKTVLQIALLLTLTISLVAQTSERYPITIEQVFRALQLDLTVVDLSIPVLTAKSAEPVLEVRGQERVSNRVILQVACADGRSCLPFLAELRFRDAGDAQLFCGKLPIPLRRRTGVPVLVKQGSKAELELITGRRVILHFAVRILQSGRLGEMVRVRDEHSRHVYLARVVRENQVRSEL